MTLKGEYSHVLGNAFSIALLLTGNADDASASVLEGIGALDEGVSFSSSTLIRLTAKAAAARSGKSDEETKDLAILPLELRRLFLLSPRCRGCFVLRFLAGMRACECSAVLGLSDRQFEGSIGEALHSLADKVLADVHGETEFA